MSEIIIRCNKEDMAVDVSNDVNMWWSEMDQVVRNDYLSCIDELEEGDTIILANYVCSKEANALRVEEH